MQQAKNKPCTYAAFTATMHAHSVWTMNNKK